MKKEEKSVSLYTEQLIRLVDEFRERLKNGTHDPDNFLTISEIEHLWSELKGKTSILYSDILEEAL